MTTLIVAEKNQAAIAIAEALGPTKTIKKTTKLNVYQVPSKNIYVVPLRGHILEYRNIGKYESWTKSNPREIITNPNAIKKIPITHAKSHISALKEYSKLSNECIIGTDADIEGCNIGLIDALPYIKRINPNIKISQLWLSSLQKSEIQKKFNSLIKPMYSWAETGEARAIIDAVIGFSATREVTATFRPLLSKFNVKFTSIGRVQTSLLYLIYLRNQEIVTFVPEPYYIIEAILIHDSRELRAHHVLNPFKKEDETKAKSIYQKILGEKIAYITDNTTKQVKRAPPAPLNTNKALQLLTRTLHITANNAMKIMNDLYLNKLITYPRTDTDIYKPDFDHLNIINKFLSHSVYGNYTSKLSQNKRIKPTKGKKDAGDHPPITPLESIERGNSSLKNNLHEKVYDILARHYLALFGEPATESKQELKVLIKDEPFRAQFVSLVSEGFLAIAPFLKPKYDTQIQISCSTLPVDEILFERKETKPPPRYTDTTLLKLMEKHHLGTKATRPVIIKILQKRKLITRNKRQYNITDLGVFIIENLIKVWLPILKPEFTRKVEKKLEEIKHQSSTMNDVISEIKSEFLQLYDDFVRNRANFKLDASKYQVKKVSTSTSHEIMTESTCPNCNNQRMKFINLPSRRFLACANRSCKSYLSLPKKGKLELLNTKCSICGFNVFKITTRKNNKSYAYYLCPKCWNDNLKEKNGKGFCSNCDEFKITDNKCVKK